MFYRSTVGALAVAICLGAAGCSTQDASTPPPSATPPSSSPSGVGATQRDNQVNLQAGKGVNSLAFNFSGNYSITADQQSTWGGVTNCQSQKTCTINVQAGRQQSAPVAAWFTSNAPSFGCTFSSQFCQPVSVMNFAFTGTLTVNGQTYPLTLGQNGDGVANYWYFGGPGYTPAYDLQADETQPVFTPDGVYALNLSSGNNNIVVAVAAGTYVTPSPEVGTS